LFPLNIKTGSTPDGRGTRLSEPREGEGRREEGQCPIRRNGVPTALRALPWFGDAKLIKEPPALAGLIRPGERLTLGR
jgi:hypothetical protein